MHSPNAVSGSAPCLSAAGAYEFDGQRCFRYGDCGPDYQPKGLNSGEGEAKDGSHDCRREDERQYQGPRVKGKNSAETVNLKMITPPIRRRIGVSEPLRCVSHQECAPACRDVVKERCSRSKKDEGVDVR